MTQLLHKGLSTPLPHYIADNASAFLWDTLIQMTALAKKEEEQPQRLYL